MGRVTRIASRLVRDVDSLTGRRNGYDRIAGAVGAALIGLGAAGAIWVIYSVLFEGVAP